MTTTNDRDQLAELVFKGIGLLENEFNEFAKSAADSLRVEELNKSIRALTESVQNLPKSDVIHFRKVLLAAPAGCEEAMAELARVLRTAGFRGV